MSKPFRLSVIAYAFCTLSAIFILCALFLPLQTAQAANLLYAAPTAQGSGNCSSWANACTLQTALTNAVSGDEIWVKAGVHYPGAAGNRAATFTLKDGVAVYGGFVGTETSLSQRDWVANKTILSGDIGTVGNNSDNAYHVVYVNGVTYENITSATVIDGFTITGGGTRTGRIGLTMSAAGCTTIAAALASAARR